MRSTRTARVSPGIARLALVVFSVLQSCARTVVGDASSPDGSDSGAFIEASSDVHADATSDVGLDVGADHGPDAAADASIDHAFDVGVDVATDAAADHAIDVVSDASADHAMDVAPDASADQVTDVAPDAQLDSPAACDAGQTRCAMTCVDTQTDLANCGGCGSVCPAEPNGSPTCASGRCGIACAPGFGDCDRDPTNGCEADLSSLATCGTCANACTTPTNGTVACSAGACVVTCDAGYVVSGTSCSVPAPRPIAPLSTSTVTSQQPLLTWVLGPGTDGAHVAICADRACTTVVAAFDSLGTSGAPAAALAPGVYFWRLAGTLGGAIGTATSPTWEFIVGARSAPVNTSWGTTLDVNGDGFADVAVGAYEANGNTGRAYVYLGGAGGLSSTPAASLTGIDEPGSFFGYPVASAGDINGDGYGDLAVGAPGTNSGAGAVYVYLGGPSGLATTPSVSLTGPQVMYSGFGHAIAGAGDLNADGYADIVVGTPQATEARVFLGSPTGLSTVPSAILSSPDGSGGQYGSSVATAGDVNGDGLGDIVVSELGYNNNAGRAFVYLGSPSGLVTTPFAVLDGPDGMGTEFGYSVACAGDTNGDGFTDLVVSAPTTLSNVGSAYVFEGGASIAPMPVSTIVAPDGPNSGFGVPVANAGDVNGDGLSDIVVAAGNELGGTGRAFVFVGTTSGGVLGPTPFASFTGPDGMTGYFAISLAGAGDVNGDGFADLIIAAYGTDNGAGRAYLFPGIAGGLAATPAVTLLGLDGPGALFGDWVASVDGSDRMRSASMEYPNDAVRQRTRSRAFRCGQGL